MTEPPDIESPSGDTTEQVIATAEMSEVGEQDADESASPWPMRASPYI
jgi:hypothetical protein